MSKRNLGAKNALYPMPMVIVGTTSDDKRNNYNAIAHIGIIDHGTISISMGKVHWSNQWIKKNKTLSINIPSADMAKEMDYVGTVSGSKTSKSEIFETFPGELDGAPLIKNAPIAMECDVIDIYDRPEFDVFICRIVNTYVDDSVLSDEKIDYRKVNPIFYDMPNFGYWKLGEYLERAFMLSKDMRESNKEDE